MWLRQFSHLDALHAWHNRPCRIIYDNKFCETVSIRLSCHIQYNENMYMATIVSQDHHRPPLHSTNKKKKKEEKCPSNYFFIDVIRTRLNRWLDNEAINFWVRSPMGDTTNTYSVADTRVGRLNGFELFTYWLWTAPSRINIIRGVV